jgi:hypothetical protein
VNGPNATYAPAPVRPKRSLSWVGPAIVILFAAVLMAGAARLVQEPDTVGKVRIVNPVDDVVDIDVREPGGPWLPLGAVDPQSATTVYDVVDADGPWIVRFKVSDETRASVKLSHERLERARWRITVPTLVN